MRFTDWIESQGGRIRAFAVGTIIAAILLLSFAGLATLTRDVEPVAHAQAVGTKAVEYALKGMNGVMPVIVRTSDSPYRWKIAAAPLTDIANAEKTMPKSFIDRSGYGITAACRRYLQPLVRGEAPPPYRADGLPAYVRLRLAPVAKKLPAFG